VARGKLRETEVIRAQRLAAQTDETHIPALLVKLGWFQNAIPRKSL
jgi:hypothetical protein